MTHLKKDLVAFCQLAGLRVSGTRDVLVSRIQSYLRRYKYPERYFSSSVPRWIKKMEMRQAELQERQSRSKDSRRTYAPTQTDRQVGPPKRSSRYTYQWKKRYPTIHTLDQIEQVTGIPIDILQRVYDKGLAAWRGGHHRPGASQHAWAMARVYSFVLKGKTHVFPDHLLVKQAKRRSERATMFWQTL